MWCHGPHWRAHSRVCACACACARVRVVVYVSSLWTGCKFEALAEKHWQTACVNELIPRSGPSHPWRILIHFFSVPGGSERAHGGPQGHSILERKRNDAGSARISLILTPLNPVAAPRLKRKSGEMASSGAESAESQSGESQDSTLSFCYLSRPCLSLWPSSLGNWQYNLIVPHGLQASSSRWKCLHGLGILQGCPHGTFTAFARQKNARIRSTRPWAVALATRTSWTSRIAGEGAVSRK